jgi:hypothetical protein
MIGASELLSATLAGVDPGHPDTGSGSRGGATPDRAPGRRSLSTAHRSGQGIPTVLISDSAISRKEDVIRRVLAHHAQQTQQAAARARPAPAPGYRPETLDVLFSNDVP